jgi:hypothetical protein
MFPDQVGSVSRLLWQTCTANLGPAQAKCLMGYQGD